MVQTKSNGHDPTGDALSESIEEREVSAVDDAKRGAHVRLSDLKREDGLIADALDKSLGTGNQQGVLKAAMTAAKADEDYRQELKTANFSSRNKAFECIAALDESRECGLDITPILDSVIAQSAGVNADRLDKIFGAYSNATVSTVSHAYQDNKKNFSGNKSGGLPK